MNDDYCSDSWLSAILEKDSFHFSEKNFSQDLFEKFLKDLKSKPLFADIKISTENIPLIELITKMGFYLIDTNVTFEKSLDISKENAMGQLVIRKSSPSDMESVNSIASKCFKFTRFHLDPRTQVFANKIKQKWVENFYHGKRGDHMLVALKDNKIVGFNQILLKHNGAIIDLIGVDENFQKQGVGNQLIGQLNTLIPDVSSIVVGTQISNIPSLRFYEKNDFKIIKSQYVFHYHLS